MKLVVLGAPGAGKGTQARNLADHYQIAHISTGDILRDNIKNHTELGIKMAAMISAGELIPDEVAIELVTKEVANNPKGFVLDGYPRTLAQAAALEDIAETITKAISINVCDSVIVERMSGRVTCPDCGAMYHNHYHPPKKTGICDVCGGKLIQRDDDKAKTVKNRLKVYHRLTEPIIHYYRDKNLLAEFDGEKEIDAITSAIVKSLGEEE